MTPLDSKKPWENTEQQLQIWKTWFPIFYSTAESYTIHARVAPEARYSRATRECIDPGIPGAERKFKVSRWLQGGGHRESCAVWFLMRTCIFSNQQIIILKKKQKIPFISIL